VRLKLAINLKTANARADHPRSLLVRAGGIIQ
jgi:hypothetical protein